MAMKPPNKFLHLFGEAALSLLAFLILFILVSDLSTDLLNNTKFWFFISNTLVFIIAADFGAFSPPATNFHGGGNRRSNNSATQFPNQENPQHNFKIVVTEPANSANQISHTTELVDNIHIKFVQKKSYQRSKSEKVRRMGEKDRKSSMRIRSKTMIRYEASKMIQKDKKNEFAEMTDEELNTRIEDFIERFNTKIKFEQMLGHGNEKEFRGPLVDSYGHIIGVNTATFTRKGSGMSSGVNFAIPIDTVVRTVPYLIVYGTPYSERF